MSSRRTAVVAAGAAALGAVAGYVAARRGPGRQLPTRADQHADAATDDRVIRVTPRQVEAARVAIEARKLLDEPIPPGLQRIADARPVAHRQGRVPRYVAPERKVIEVAPHQVKAAQVAVKGLKRLGKPVPPGLQRIADVGSRNRLEQHHKLYSHPDNREPQGPPHHRSPRETAEHATEAAWEGLEQQYGLYRASEIGQMLGYTPHRTRVEDQHAAGLMLGVRRGSSLRYPGFQVGPDGKLAPIVGDLISLARGQGWTDESLALWLANSSGSMPDGRPPAELLHEDPQLVLEAAKRIMQPSW